MRQPELRLPQRPHRKEVKEMASCGCGCTGTKKVSDTKKTTKAKGERKGK